jgi:Nrap protein nucleotidyltransferase domain 4
MKIYYQVCIYVICHVQDGYLFRLKVGFNHEIVLHKKQVLPDGKQKLSDNEESAALEYQYLTLPRLTSCLHGYMI